MKLRYYTAILFASLTLLVGCGKGNDPKPDGSDGEIWYPEKSQPGVFKVPEALKSNNNQYAKQAYEGVKELEDLIATYSDYFLAPEGTKNTSLPPQVEHRYAYSKDNHTVAYMYADYSSTHRVFELKIEDASGTHVAIITGDWWENWNADDGKPENGKHYGKVVYITGAGAKERIRDFSWKDDGGGNYRVHCYFWQPGESAGLDRKYEYTFNADQSGGYVYNQSLSTGHVQYNTQWTSNGSGSLNIVSGPNPGTYQW